MGRRTLRCSGPAPRGTDEELLPGVVIRHLAKHFVAEARSIVVRRLV